MPAPLPIGDRVLRVGIVGLGQVSELCLPPYRARHDVEVVGLCDERDERLARWSSEFPGAATATNVDTLLALQPDVVDILVPTPLHGPVATHVLDAGFHVQVQKPLARSLEDADRMVEAAQRSGATLRVLEDYLFYPPLVKLREVVQSGEIGEPVAVHMKIVAAGRGGWDVPMSSYVWLLEQAKDGRGILTFDHGCHQLAVARWLFGPIRRVFGWIGATQAAPDLAPDVMIDAPATVVWEHTNGVRGVLDITFARDMYIHADYYADDERVEVTGSRGFVRCNGISARGVQEPSVVAYCDGQTRAFHAIPDRPPDAFASQAAHGIEWFRTGAGDLLMDGPAARDVLRVLTAVLESSRSGVPIDCE